MHDDFLLFVVAGRDVASQKIDQPARLLPGQHDGLQSLGLPLGNACRPTALQSPPPTPTLLLLKNDRTAERERHQMNFQ